MPAVLEDLLKAQYRKFIEFACETFGEEYAVQLIEWIPTHHDFAAIIYASFNQDWLSDFLTNFDIQIDEMELKRLTNIINQTKIILDDGQHAAQHGSTNV